MTIIFKALSRNGTALIDESWRCLSLVSKRVFAGNGILNILRYDDYTIMALASETECFIQAGAIYSNGYNWVDTYIGQSYVKGTVTVYEFSDVEIQRDPLGMNIRNSLGVLVFSSLLQPLRVIYHQAGYINHGGGDYVLYEAYLPSDRKYAVVIGNNPMYLKLNNTSVDVHCINVTTRSDGYVKVEYKRTNISRPRSATLGGLGISSNYSFQIIDVTYY